MSNTKIVIIIVLLAVVGVGGWYLVSHKTAPVPAATNTSTSEQTSKSNSDSTTPSTEPTQASTQLPASSTPATNQTSAPQSNPTYKVPTLALSPSSSNISAGQSFDVNLILDTAGQSIDGVDVYQLHFDPKLLSLTVTPGTLMPIIPYNKIDNGTFGFSQLTQPGTHYTGNGVLVTLHFKALSSGTATVTLDYTPGQANKSNIAANGKNVLQQVINATYTIK